jgi:hypothetical protein
MGNVNDQHPAQVDHKGMKPKPELTEEQVNDQHPAQVDHKEYERNGETCCIRLTTNIQHKSIIKSRTNVCC